MCYYIYRLSFGDQQYIGCTNNIRRRKDQHNENARKRKSKLGQFLDDNGIVLDQNDFEIIASYDDRSSALAHEREYTLGLARQNASLLNDNYSKECTRKGKNIGNTAKEYVVVNFIRHTFEQVVDLRQYCLANNLNYKSIQRTATSGKYSEQGYVAFLIEDWNNLQNKSDYISGNFVSTVQEKATAARISKTSKEYEVQFPDGHVERVINIDKFAREHNLSSGTLHATFIKNKPTKGYQILSRLSV